MMVAEAIFLAWVCCALAAMALAPGGRMQRIMVVVGIAPFMLAAALMLAVAALVYLVLVLLLGAAGWLARLVRRVVRA